MAIQTIYRDLEYAKTLIKARTPGSYNPSNAALPEDDFGDIEESWTFIGAESDPELLKRTQDWDGVRAPRVSIDARTRSLSRTLDTVGRRKSKK